MTAAAARERDSNSPRSAISESRRFLVAAMGAHSIRAICGDVGRIAVT
jgi:hypothetical protein